MRTPNRALSTVADLGDRVRRGTITSGDLLRMSISATIFTVADIVTGKFSWEEFLDQAWFMIKVSILPTILVAIPFGIIVSVQIGGIAGQIGASSFSGAANGAGVLRQGAPLVTSLIIAGVVGSAITADLGARAVREEVDAMMVMGLSPVRRLVGPRILAAILVSMGLCAVVASTAILAGFALVVGKGDVSSGTYLGAFASFSQTSDLVLAVLKAAIFGFLAALVACHKGLNATGGPKGVADAVNQSVVISVVLLAVVNVGITQSYVMLAPQGSA